MPMINPFTYGKRYKRKEEIHNVFGGNPQGGICPSSRYPYIFIFSGSGGIQHGYQDGWENTNVYAYTGEGQTGNMEFVRGNLALRDHLKNNKRVFLFEYRNRGIVEFVAELEFLDCDFFPSHDTNNKDRIAIKFFLKRKGAVLNYDLKRIPEVQKTRHMHLENLIQQKEKVSCYRELVKVHIERVLLIYGRINVL